MYIMNISKIANIMIRCLLMAGFLAAESVPAQNVPGPVKSPSSIVGKQYPSSATVLNNGMEVVMIENHADPMVACFVIVRCGQRDETADIAGVGHFLEHAIFDGTEHRSKKQLYDDFDFLGSYVNASTKHDYTEFFILSPRETFNRSLDLLRDMIFHSVFPPDTLEQERGIVLEEIKRDFDQPSQQADDLFSRIFYQGTPYAHPILGSIAGIKTMPREKLVEFYKKYYVPNNMVCVVIGDFEPEAMSSVIDTTFGGYPPGDLPKKDLLDLSSPFLGSANHVVKFPGNVDKCFLRVGIEVPNVWSEDYYAAKLATEILDPYFQMRLTNSPDSSITDISVDYFEDRDFATLNFYVDVPEERFIGRAVANLFQMLSALHYWVTEDKVVAAIQDHRSRDILQGQRLQMYGMMNSQIFAQGGYPLWRFQPEYWGKVRATDVMNVTDKYFDYPQYIATCLVPFSEAGEEAAASTQEKVTIRDTLDNGIVVIVWQDRDAPIFAAHLLAKGRALREGPEHAGYADLLHRILGQALVVDGAPLNEALQRIGAEFETTDNPYIPYDDYRTTPEYSYMRMECLDDFEPTALKLFGEILTQSPIDSETVARVKTEELGILASKQASANWRANRLFLTTMLGPNHPLAQPEIGTPATIETATVAKLISFDHTYFSGSNLILTAITSNNPAEVMELAREKFSSLPSVKLPPLEYPPPPEASGRVEETIGKKQSAVRLGVVLRNIDPADRAALEVWNGWVNDRLAFVIREERGWAYSVWSSLWFIDGWALWEAGWGTSPGNVDTSITVAKDVVAKCLSNAPTDHDLERIVNQLLRNAGMRRMTRINQAMYMGISAMDGVNRDWSEWSESIREVTGKNTRQTIGKYFNAKKIVEVVVR
jgi:zinc protease